MYLRLHLRKKCQAPDHNADWMILTALTFTFLNRRARGERIRRSSSMKPVAVGNSSMGIL
jgi:hypothetical protein